MFKAIILSAVFIFYLFAYENAFAYDSTAAKYMPLQIGNMWVYYGSAGQQAPPYQSYWFAKYRITGTLDTIGKRYYKTQETILIISGGVYCSVLSQLMRVDSTTMNIKAFVIGCSQGEHLIDSLNSRKNDSAEVCNFALNKKDVLTDTSLINIFGNSFPSKYFIHTDFESTDSRKYTKSLGMVYDSYSYHSGGCYENLIGCFVGGVLYGDTSMIIGIHNVSTEVPKSFSLSQNYPNPFNPSTKIKFDVTPPLPLPKGEGRNANSPIVKLVIYDALGREVSILVNQQLKPGTYETEWDASNYPSGVYFYKLEAVNFSQTKKLVLIK